MSCRVVPFAAVLAAALLAVPVSAQVLINELDADQPGTDSAEFIELFDGGTGNTPLDGLVLVLYNGNGDASYQAFDLDGQATDADGYFVICGDATNVGGCDLDVSPNTNLVQNGADGAALYMADAADFPNGTPATSANLLDGLVYGTNDSPDAALIAILDPGGTQANDTTSESLGRCPNGSGAFIAAVPTPGAANDCGDTAVIVINEVDADQSGTDAAEFVELYDGGTGNAPLDGLVLVFFNGNGDVAYEAFDLDGLATDADGYFVICGDSTNVVGCDLDVTPNTNLVQNGADAIGLYAADAADFPDGTAVTDTGLIDALVYGTNDATDTVLIDTLTPGGTQVNDDTTQSMGRCANGDGGFVLGMPTPGAENSCDSGPLDTTIPAIQGSGPVSPLVGEDVLVTGIVTGDFQDNVGTSGDLNGFYLQDLEGDGDASTSDGIFVFEGSDPAIDLQPGDLVSVRGIVNEFFGETQINATGADAEITVLSTGNVAASPINLPTVGIVTNSDGELIGDLEQYEGMLVTFPQTLSVTELFNLDRFGELRLAQGGRLFQFTNSNTPDVSGFAAYQASIAALQIMLDDGLTVQNPDPIRYPNGGLSTANTVRMGDTVTGLTGNIRFSRGSGGSGDETYRLMPTVEPVFVAANLRPPLPAVAGSLKIASLNVLNYFTTIDESGAVCGPGSVGCRGADNAAELARQQQKLVTALQALDADIYGLVELENNYDPSFQNTPGSAAESLASLLNDAGGTTACGPNFVAVDPGRSVGDDVIAVGLLYCDATVDLAGETTVEVLDDSVLPGLGLGGLAPVFDGEDTNRAALAASFADAQGGVLTVAVNHFKSKGGGGTGPDADLGDGAGNWNQRRSNAAIALAEWLATDPTGSGDSDFLIIGDLNAYAKEDPVQALINDGYTDLIEEIEGERYSFVFDGQAGSLDYALASPSLVDQVGGVAEWHINADEPDALDYNLDFGRPPAIFDGTVPFRNSDHDPVIIGLTLTAAIPGDLNGDGLVNFVDVGIFKSAFGAVDGDEDYNPAADLNDDGVINFVDLRLLRQAFFNGS